MHNKEYNINDEDDHRELISFIKDNCKNYINYVKKNGNKGLLYRGIGNGLNNIAVLKDYSDKTRISANTSNYYTVILDHYLAKRNLPLRSKGVICTNDLFKASRYGTKFLVIPLDDVKQYGICTYPDIWEVPLKLDGYKDQLRLRMINDYFDALKISFESYDVIVDRLSKRLDSICEFMDDMGSSKSLEDFILNWFDIADHLEETFGIDPFDLEEISKFDAIKFTYYILKRTGLLTFEEEDVIKLFDSLYDIDNIAEYKNTFMAERDSEVWFNGKYIVYPYESSRKLLSEIVLP